MKIIPIDPGKNGAIGLMEDTRVIDVVDTPVLGKKYDCLAIFEILQDFKLQGAEIMILEFAHGLMKGKGGSSSSNIREVGFGTGMWTMAATVLELRLEEVQPCRWTKGLGLAKDATKADHAALAYRLFPSAVSKLKGVRGGLKDGRIDAVLIGEWYLRQMRGENKKPSTRKAKEAA